METQTLELAPVQPDEAPMKQLAPFDLFRAQAEKLKATAETLTVTDINDKAGMKLARATRLELREVRIAIDKRRKELGEHHLRESQRINADAKELRELIEPLEARLQLQEDFIEVETKRIADEKRSVRASELTPFLSSAVAIDLGTMTDEDYSALLSDSKDAHTAKLAREQKEKEEAAARLKAEVEERERIRLENERLKKEAEEREAAARKEREAAAAALAKEREEAARLAKEAQAKADADAAKIRAEAAERERIASEKATADAEKARKEREAIEAERAKVAAELATKKAAEEKAAADKLATEKAAAMAPKKEKLQAFAKAVRQLSLPLLAEVSDVKDFAEGVERFAKWVEKKASELGGELL